MNKVKFEEMVPAELLAEMQRNATVYLPVGSMEWHGPHMGMGMDTINAYQVSLGVAQKLGGAVLPPLYIGTEEPRDRDTLRRLGFGGGEAVVGMDFPANSVKSFYWPEDLFRRIVEEQINMLLRMGYRLIVLMNGHGACNQLRVLQELGELYSSAVVAVLPIMALFEGGGAEIGHAGLAETAIMRHLCPQGVQMDRLPPRSEKLRNVDHAIVDNETFTNGPNEDYTVRHDPRDATGDLGEKLVRHAVEQSAALVAEARIQLGFGPARQG